jgi:predicted transcriptional regulator
MDYTQFGQLALAAVVTIMVLKFLFKMVEKKFDEQKLEQQVLNKVVETDSCVDNIAKTIDKVSISQEKIVESQTKLVIIMDSIDRRINGR